MKVVGIQTREVNSKVFYNEKENILISLNARDWLFKISQIKTEISWD